MQITITAVGPDHRGLADPIIHYVTSEGANIAEIQMYDHDEHNLFAMLIRVHLPEEKWDTLVAAMVEIGQLKGLSIRVWSPERCTARPRLAICTTIRSEPPLALLRAIRDNTINAEAVLMLGNRPNCRCIADQFGIDWHLIGDEKGVTNDNLLVKLCDEYEVDYIILARYMRILPPETCWKYAGGRIINLHHGLLPSFPGMRPYHDAYSARMLVFGATCHYVVPELDEGGQIIAQSSFSVSPEMSLAEIVRIGEQDNEPQCLLEGVKRVVEGQVQLHYHRVIPRVEK